MISSPSKGIKYICIKQMQKGPNLCYTSRYLDIYVYVVVGVLIHYYVF